MAKAPMQKVQDFFSKYPKHTYPKGQVLLFPDQDPEAIMYVVSGKVRCYGSSYRGDDVIVNVFADGAYFPMSWVLGKIPNDYFYRTESESTIHVAPPDEVFTFIDQNPDVLIDLTTRLYKGLKGMQGRMVHMMSGTAKTRVLYELMVEARRFGTVQDNASYQLAISETDLAARTGLSRETVSREAKKLKECGWLAVTGKTLCVLRLDEVEKSLQKRQ